MAFGRKARQIRELREAVAKLAEENQARSTTSSASELLARVLDGNVKTAEVFTTFVGALGDLAVKRSASLLGSRGGRARVRNKKAREEAARNDGCPLCKNPNAPMSALSVKIIEAHQSHEAAQLSLPPPDDEVGN